MNSLSGSLGDIFWSLSPWIVYAPSLDLGCSIYVANPTDEEREYALMARLSRNTTLISEEALPVFGYTWFKVDPRDFVRLHGAFRFNESDADLTVQLVERETEEATDSVSTRLVAPTTAAFPPGWPGMPGFDWSSLWAMMLPVMMMGIMGIVIVSAVKPKEKKEKEVTSTEEKETLPPGR